jgi:hypothetical protein
MFRTAQKAVLPIAVLFAVILYSAFANTTGKVDISALWVERTDLEKRDLFYGPGGPERAPRHMEFQFIEEDKSGTTPKYIVRDADGVEWKMKLGEEARPETAASRLVWAAGYYAREEYFLASAYLKNLPAKLKRGEKEIGPMGDVHHARLQRLDTGKKVGVWPWMESPFGGTREFNGLRVMIAVINSWDMKDTNNSIIELPDGKRIYCVCDVGSSLGGTTLRSPEGHLKAYQKSEFITETGPETVSFSVPGRSTVLEHVVFPMHSMRKKQRWIGQDIPREHARWLGERLGKLSPTQIRDAFKASGFSPEEVEGFALVLEGRIAALKAL